MNYVKKLLSNKITIIVLFGIIIIVTVVFLLIRDKKEFLFLTYPKEHCVLSKDDNPMFTVEIYSNHKNSEYLKEEVIDSIKVYDFNSNDFLSCKVDNIEMKDGYIDYEKNHYYKYQLDLVLPIKKDTEFKFDKAYLNINYLNSESLSFYIGNLNVYEYQSKKAFIINRMKGFIDNINSQDTLTGIYMELINVSNNNVIIKEINYTSNNIISNYDYLMVVDSISENYKEKISNIVNDEYDYFRRSSLDDCFIEVNDDVLKLFIPLTYIKERSVNSTGIIIKYMIDGNTYQQVIDPFVFFNSFEKNIGVEQVVYNPNRV